MSPGNGRGNPAEAVLVLKLDHNPFHHGALGIVRSLGRHGVRVHAVIEDRASPIAWSRYLHGAFLWNPDPTDTEALLRGLATIGRSIGGRPILIPVDDAGAILIAEHAAALGASFRFPDQPTDVPRRLASKSGLAEICLRAGVPTPAVREFHFPAELLAATSELEYPAVVKVSQPWIPRMHSRLRSTTIVGSEAELRELAADLAVTDAPPVLVQEYLPAATCEDWFFHGCVGQADDGTAAFRLSVTGRKLRSYPVEAGLTSFGRAWDNPELRQIAEHFLSAVGYRGIVDLDVRLDRRTGTYHLLDANPRPGAQFAIARRSDDVDAALALYRELTGHPLPRQTAQSTGHALCVENYDLLSTVSSIRHRRLTPSAWLRTWRTGPVELAWFAADDLLPWVVMCLRFASRLLTRRRPARPARHPWPRRWMCLTSRALTLCFLVRRYRTCRRRTPESPSWAAAPTGCRSRRI